VEKTTNQTSLELHFVSDGELVELVLSKFTLPRYGVFALCRRGKSSNVLRATGAFQWTRAVQCLCSYLVKYALHDADSSEPYLQIGGAGSVASSVDLAVAKSPTWVRDVFGCTSRGQSVARKLFIRTNSERRMLGPVVVGVNENLLPPGAIRVFSNGSRVIDATLLRQLSDRLQSSIDGEQSGNARTQVLC
jgi:hypothetical protein